MTDPKAQAEATHIVEQNELLNRAIWRKWNKFIWSGSLLIVIGLVVIAVGLLLRTGAYSAEGVLVGIGAIVVLVGIIRLLIGIINPLAPGDVHASSPSTSSEDLDTVLNEQDLAND